MINIIICLFLCELIFGEIYPYDGSDDGFLKESSNKIDKAVFNESQELIKKWIKTSKKKDSFKKSLIELNKLRQEKSKELSNLDLKRQRSMVVAFLGGGFGEKLVSNQESNGLSDKLNRLKEEILKIDKAISSRINRAEMTKSLILEFLSMSYFDSKRAEIDKLILWYENLTVEQMDLIASRLKTVPNDYSLRNYLTLDKKIQTTQTYSSCERNLEALLLPVEKAALIIGGSTLIGGAIYFLSDDESN